jgi:hypothetical protein
MKIKLIELVTVLLKYNHNIFWLLVIGIVLTKVGYYTIPSMDDLAKITNEKGECIVSDFTIGRKGKCEFKSHIT